MNIVVDVESDGPCPGIFSMISLAAIVVEPGLSRCIKIQCRPDDPTVRQWLPEALASCRVTREAHLSYPEPDGEVRKFALWLAALNSPTMWSDNPAFDWQWVNYNLWRYAGSNPLGHSARRIGDLYCGIKRDLHANRQWKKLRDTRHTHDPLDDARGNAEALLKIFEMLKK
ncbi:MAG: exonuclease [Armatimonadota bacterium]|nr:exonuclease [Armatimonadota bacterium]